MSNLLIGILSQNLVPLARLLASIRRQADAHALGDRQHLGQECRQRVEGAIAIAHMQHFQLANLGHVRGQLGQLLDHPAGKIALVDQVADLLLPPLDLGFALGQRDGDAVGRLL